MSQISCKDFTRSRCFFISSRLFDFIHFFYFYAWNILTIFYPLFCIILFTCNRIMFTFRLCIRTVIILFIRIWHSWIFFSNLTFVNYISCAKTKKFSLNSIATLNRFFYRVWCWQSVGIKFVTICARQFLHMENSGAFWAAGNQEQVGPVRLNGVAGIGLTVREAQGKVTRTDMGLRSTIMILPTLR